MSGIASRLDTRSDAFRANAERNSGLVEELRAKVRAVKEGGGERARERHLGRGKPLPRDRVRTLLDPGDPFLEFSQLAADGLYDGAVPSAGIVTGIGRILGRESRSEGRRVGKECVSTLTYRWAGRNTKKNQ